MTPSEATEIHGRAYAQAINSRFFEDADDIAQGAVLLKMVRKGELQTAEQLAIDSIRQLHGDPRRDCHEVREALREAMCEGDIRIERIAAPEDDQNFNRFLQSLDGQTRAVGKLFYEWGLLRKDILDVLGLSYQNIHDELDNIETAYREWIK